MAILLLSTIEKVFGCGSVFLVDLFRLKGFLPRCFLALLPFDKFSSDSFFKFKFPCLGMFCYLKLSFFDKSSFFGVFDFFRALSD